MSAALSPIAASASLSAWSCVCCATLPALVAAVEVESEAAALFDVFGEFIDPSPFGAAAMAPPLACPAAAALEAAPTAVERFVSVVDCPEAETRFGKAAVFGALNNPAASAVEFADSVSADGVN